MIRTLENGFHQRWASNLTRDLARERQAYLAAQAIGDTDTAAVIVGEAIDLVREVESAAEVISRIASGAEILLGTFQMGAARPLGR